MMPIAGRIIDWLGLRLGFTLSIITWSIAQMITAFATGWRSFAVFRSLLGITEAGNFPGGAKAVAQWFRPKERTLATGIFNMGAGIGALIAPPLVAWLILDYSWQTAFVVTGAFGLFWAVLWAWLYRSPEKHPWLSEEGIVAHKGRRAGACHGESAQRKGRLENCLAAEELLGVGNRALFFGTGLAVFQLLDTPLPGHRAKHESEADRLFRVAAFPGGRPRFHVRRRAVAVFHQ